MPIGFMLAWECQSQSHDPAFPRIHYDLRTHQSILHLGIFDVDDILLNTFGFAAGFLRKTMPIPADGACRSKGISSPSANDDALENSTICPTPRTIHQIAQSQPAHGSIIPAQSYEHGEKQHVHRGVDGQIAALLVWTLAHHILVANQRGHGCDQRTHAADWCR